jgi:hypothetical protein
VIHDDDVRSGGTLAGVLEKAATVADRGAATGRADLRIGFVKFA